MGRRQQTPRARRRAGARADRKAQEIAGRIIRGQAAVEDVAPEIAGKVAGEVAEMMRLAGLEVRWLDAAARLATSTPGAADLADVERIRGRLAAELVVEEGDMTLAEAAEVAAVVLRRLGH